VPVDAGPLGQAVAQAHHHGVPFAGTDRRTRQGAIHQDHAALLCRAVRPGPGRHRAHGEVVHDLARRSVGGGLTLAGRHHGDAGVKKSLRVRRLFMFGLLRRRGAWRKSGPGYPRACRFSPAATTAPDSRTTPAPTSALAPITASAPTTQSRTTAPSPTLTRSQ